MSLDLSQHVEWSADEDYYYATVELRTPDGQLGTVEVRVDRPWVIRTAQEVRKRLMTSAPAGVDVGAWRNPADPARFQKLCQYVAGEEVKQQLAEQSKRDGIVIAPWFGEWTTATADSAYRMICAAKAGDETSIEQLERIREHAESGDPAARKALGMINSVAKLVARGLPAPSVVAARLPQVGALPVRRTVPARRVTPVRRPAPARPATPARTKALPPRQITPPRAKTVPAAPLPTSRGWTPPAPTRVTPVRAYAKPVAAAAPTSLASLAVPNLTSSPLVTTPLASATAQKLVQASAPLVVAPTSTVPMSPYGYPYGFPYGQGMPMTMPSSDGGGGYGDLGPADYLADEEDNGGGDMLDDDDTYHEDETTPDEVFSDEPEAYVGGEYPEEIEQSLSEDDDGDPGEEWHEGMPFPGEGSIGG